MKPCVYTTQHRRWLDEASRYEPSELLCFRSGRRWAKAVKLLDQYGVLPILIRQQDDDSLPTFACRFAGSLVQIQFAQQFESDESRLAWLNDKLWFQREALKRHWKTDRFPNWESQYKEWEVDKFMKARTWYSVAGIHEIEALQLPRLRKLNGGYPLAANFGRGYALCQYPEDEVRRIHP